MKTLNLNDQNFDILPMETDFSFDDVANEICVEETETTKDFEQIYLDGPNGSKFMVAFQYSDLDKNFIDDDIFYSEEIEVKEENERIENDDNYDVFHVPSNVMDVQNEVIIKDESSHDVDGYGQAIQKLSRSVDSKLSEDNYHKKEKVKEEPDTEKNSVKIEPKESEKPKSIFGAAMGVSKCNICNKYTKRSCYEAHMKKHYEDEESKRKIKEEETKVFAHEAVATSISNPQVKLEPPSSAAATTTNPRVSSKAESSGEEDQKFRCSQCDYLTFNENDLSHHMKLHDCQKLNKCPFCDYESPQIITMKAHIKSHENNASYECSECTYRTKEKTHFTRHMRRHKGDKPYKCNLCEYSAVNGSALKNHIRRHYGEKPHRCPFCEYRSVERTSLVRHIRVHTGDKPHACPYCDYKSIQKASLRTHLKRHHEDTQDRQRNDKKVVQKIPKKLMSQSQKKNDSDKVHKCQLCNYQSVQKTSLLAHMRRHLGVKPYQCPHCEYSCVEKTHLNRHLRQHTGEKPIFCFVCDYRCIQFSSLISHYKKHEGALIPCGFCPYKTVRTELILSHIKTEHRRGWSSLNSVCPLCKLECKTKKALASHMALHLEPFTEESSKTVSNEVYKCSLCEYKCVSKKLLKAHKKCHKKNKKERLS